MPRIYQETFDRGTGGWWGFAGNHLGLQPLGWRRGAVTSRSPWWIDFSATDLKVTATVTVQI
jgi:hypothetical protein